MKIAERDGSHERKILTGMITSKPVLGRIAADWTGKQFSSKWANLIGSWAVHFYQKHNAPPGKGIETIFEQWAEKQDRDQATVDLVESFLSSLSEEYQNNGDNGMNPNQLIDIAGDHFNRVKITKLKDSIESALDANELDKAREHIDNFAWLEMGPQETVDVFTSRDFVKSCFSEEGEDLITYPGDAGEFFRGALSLKDDDGFIAFQAPEKTGKCIAGDMKVLQATGQLKTIAEIVEWRDPTPVISYNEETKQFQAAAIGDWWDNGEKECWEVRLKSGRVVVTTHNHQFLTPGGWAYLEDMGTRNYVAVHGNPGNIWDMVVAITYAGKRHTYDLTIPSTSNFVANDCVVHNTFWLLDVAYRAMCQRKRVAFFQVGDMSKKQIGRRFLARNARHPYASTRRDGKYPCTVSCPISIVPPVKDKETIATVGYREMRFAHRLDDLVSWEACEKIMAEKVRSKKSYLKLSVHPNSSINVDGIRSILQRWQLEEWFPDLVILDYADILAPPPGRMEYRDAINTTWKQLRALSQEMHCLVVTATQSDADSYSKKTQDRRNFSEDKRKYAHVTGMIGINVTEEEKESGQMRLNWIVRREGAYSIGRCLHVAACLPLCNPCVKSAFRPDSEK